jgi:pimeloyl-ACP methyl ester carboxylesterase
MEFLLLIPVVLAGYTYTETKRIERNFPPNGTLVQVNGHTVHYVEQGLGRPVVLLHGASSTAQDFVFSPLFEDLAQRYRVIAPDRPGHGYSARIPQGRYPSAQADHLHALLTHLGVEKPVLVGYSWSGALATAYALRYPENTGGLVIINGATHPWPTPHSPTDIVGSLPVAGHVMSWTITMPLGRSLLEDGIKRVFEPSPVPAWYANVPADMLLRPHQFRANAEDIIGLRHEVEQHQHDYGRITAPTQILVGDEDKVVSPKIHAEALHRVVAGSRLVRVTGAGHPLHHTHTHVVREAVETLMEQQP